VPHAACGRLHAAHRYKPPHRDPRFYASPHPLMLMRPTPSAPTPGARRSPSTVSARPRTSGWTLPPAPECGRCLQRRAAVRTQGRPRPGHPANRLTGLARSSRSLPESVVRRLRSSTKQERSRAFPSDHRFAMRWGRVVRARRETRVGRASQRRRGVRSASPPDRCGSLGRLAALVHPRRRDMSDRTSE